MEKLTLNKDINLLCVRAISFPDGITEAFKKLEQASASIPGRTLYGISHGGETGIVYRAAAEAKSKNEPDELGLESYTVKRGIYATQTLKDFKSHEQQIGNTFDKLLKHPQLDESGECIEWYKHADEVTCMVRILE